MPDNEENIYTVQVSRRADSMMQEHVLFLSEVNIAAAERLLDEYTERVIGLKNIPTRYPRLDDPSVPVGKYRKLHLCERYLLLFQIRENTVYVDYVVDCRQQYQWLID